MLFIDTTVTTTTPSVIISPVLNPESPSSKWNEAPACSCIKTLPRRTEPSGVHPLWRALFSIGWIAWITWIGTFLTSSIWWVRCWSLWISALFFVIIISTITEPSPGRNHLHAFTTTCTRVEFLKLIASHTTNGVNTYTLAGVCIKMFTSTAEPT